MKYMGLFFMPKISRKEIFPTKCLMKYGWVKLLRSHLPEDKGIMGAWARLASREAFRKGKASYCGYTNEVIPGMWSGGVVGLKSILGVKSRKAALDTLEKLSQLGYITYNSLPPLPKSNGGETVCTESLYNEFYHIRTVEQFKSFYINNLDKLGTLHNTAYLYFKSFIDCLRDPDAEREKLFGADMRKSETLSIEKITEEYLRMNIPSSAAGGTYIQKIIKKYWPSATSVKNMYNRSEDVTRKSLIILYAVTEGIAPNVNYDFCD